MPSRPAYQECGILLPLCLALVFAAIPGRSAPPALRILISPQTQWGWVRESGSDSAQRSLIQTRRSQLDYYGSLGFSHVSYGLDPDLYNHFRKSQGRWVFSRERGETGTDSSLAAAKREAEARGLRLLPQLPCLSQMGAFIQWVDSGVSEFPDKREFRRFCESKHLAGDYLAMNHVAASGDNPAADQFFEEQLKLIKRGWRTGSAKAPDYIQIGHDELGFDSVCFIKAGRSRNSSLSRSELVAAEINKRVEQVARILGDSVGVILYGDSFLPTDLGERYGMAGKPNTGEGGVLWILRNRYHLEKKLIIMPWNYILADGDVHYWSRLKYDKEKQIRALERLGFGYIPGPGEHGSGGNAAANRLAPPFSLGLRRKTVQCLAEWVVAARRHPLMLRGYADQVYEPYGLCSADHLCVGYTAPLLAYAGWILPDAKPGSTFMLPAKALDRIKYQRSRWEEKWIQGDHYPAP
jgi:hypothetical protein